MGRRGASRHRLRGAILGSPTPALQEFDNLSWLRDRLFQAPEPIAAVERRIGWGWKRARRPVAQLLMTRAVEGALPFEAAWAQAPASRREALCAELGREVGRMHALRFLHADLYPRNVLVTSPRSESGGRALWFLDAWAGGPPGWRRTVRRPPEYDLGCWLADYAPGLDEFYLKTLFEAYLQARDDNGRGVAQPRRWAARVAEARRAQLRRWERQRYRLRGRPFPPAGFAMPQLQYCESRSSGSR
ncbi:MAG: lipopolysaccharide kinase InaA family protein [Planctomycetota bacterium]